MKLMLFMCIPFIFRYDIHSMVILIFNQHFKIMGAENDLNTYTHTHTHTLNAIIKVYNAILIQVNLIL